MSAKILESAQAQLLDVIENGAARSAEKLDGLSGAHWNIQVVSLDIGPGQHFRSVMARDTREHVGVHFSAPGERYLVLFSDDSGKALMGMSPLDHVGKRPASVEMEQAVLAEVANILINGLSGEMADRQGMVRIISGPTTVRGKKIDVYNQAFDDFPSFDQDSVINVLIHISAPRLAECTLMLRLDPFSINFLLNSDPDAPRQAA